ncbi:MAG: aminotransferase class I/II-fold pyridoxal phosphate-dependent enzyme [Clostridia bacterium]|nr:aminotransferase class I/II-fold pyridoxal phosphate-dependent enzyme [Clostridia bacterium]
MKYDFDSYPDRRGRDALAVDAVGRDDGFCPAAPKDGFSVIPMWVADMNFRTAPQITDAIIERAKHPLFGYYFPRDEYYNAIINWQRTRNGSAVEREWIGYENGVLGCLASFLRAFLPEGGRVLLHSPCYIGFRGTLKSMDIEAVYSPLYRDGAGVWRMDFADMEKRIKDNSVRAAVLCSPHNPTGRVWEREELLSAFELFRKYGVTVFADEIWSDIIIGENRFIPARDISEDAKARTVTACAPSKTFNLAGLIGAYHIAADGELRRKLEKEAGKTHYNSMNVLSQYALIGAYSSGGAEWADELCSVIRDNVSFACGFIEDKFKGVGLMRPQGTYMLYLDLKEYLASRGKTCEEVLRAGWDAGVAWQDGRPFLMPDSIRMNLALPAAYVREAFSRLEKYVF